MNLALEVTHESSSYSRPRILPSLHLRKMVLVHEYSWIHAAYNASSSLQPVLLTLQI